jgi:hypothetical protein
VPGANVLTCPACGASAHADEKDPALEQRGHDGGAPIYFCRECQSWLEGRGLFRTKVVRLDDVRAQKYGAVWFGTGPGKDELLRDISSGFSRGENAHTKSGVLIEGGRAFDPQRMRRVVPLYTSFHFECSRGHLVPFGYAIKTNVDIHEGWCDGDCPFPTGWAYPVWAEADVPPSSVRRESIIPPP